MNTNSTNKYNQLRTVLTNYWGWQLNGARIHLNSLFITALCKVRTVNYSKLSSGFESKADLASSMRRIQRFMAAAEFPMMMVSNLIFRLLPSSKSIVLVMDRTNWKFGASNINILMLGVSYRNVAIPLMFRMLDKRGNSSTEERIALMEDFIDWFGRDCIDCLLADREFIGEK